MANEKNLLDFPRTTTALSSDFIHISQGGVDKKISLPDFTSDLNEGNQYNITVREESSTSRTLTLADKNSYIRCLNGSTTTITVISLGSGGWKLGDYLRVRKAGAGNVTVAAGAGAAINPSSTGLSLTTTGEVGWLVCVDDTVGANVFDFVTGGASGGGGPTDFSDLGDVPVYTGNAGRSVKVNGAENSLVIGEPDVTAGTTTTSYSLTLAVWNQVKTITGSGTVAITIPLDATLDLPVGYVHVIRPDDAFSGTATWTPESGSVTVQSPAGGTLIAPAGGTSAALKIAANSWIVFGQVEAV